ncbi:4Fe-4S dicluster domain-containing protein [Adlercreutzia sp. ZJ138]|uniref:4Fe-4S dicluster domain-containing protein n=1 Tax=Adlercreutzia sp. ZJ138 TaxID=2709405 RepID=UPI0013EC99CE|nr:4Fe-4S dicluster domain-containing protein [Adlercreutzia sp. ZJ138]
MTKYAFAINLHRCVGCRTCTVSCKMENAVADGLQRIRVLNDASETTLDAPAGVYPNVSFLWRPVPCQHCDEPPCIDPCPVEATWKRDDGVVVVDKELCIGCDSCIKMCPYDARFLDETAGVVDKCDLCIRRLSNGEEKTMCELCCPNRAITVGDLDDPESAISKIIAENDVERYDEEAGTQPNVYYWWSVKKA